MYYILFGAILLIPLSGIIPIAGADIWYSQYLTLMMCSLLGISVWLWKFNKWLSLMTIIALYSVLIPAHQSPRAILCLQQLYFAIIIIRYITTLTGKQVKSVIHILFMVVLIQGLWVFLQKINHDPIFNYMYDVTRDETVGFSGSKNQIGIFFAVTTPLSLFLSPVFVLINIFGLMCSSTTFAMLGSCIAGCTFLLFTFKNKVLVLSICLVCFLIAFWVSKEKISPKIWQERRDLAKLCVSAVMNQKIYVDEASMIRAVPQKVKKVKVVTCNRWFGYGLGNFIKYFPKAQNEIINNGKQKNIFDHRYEHAHNDYLEWFTETGILGGIILSSTIISYLIRFIKANKTKLLILSGSMILAQMVCALGVYTVQTAIAGGLLILSLGILERELHGKHTEMV